MKADSYLHRVEMGNKGERKPLRIAVLTNRADSLSPAGELIAQTARARGHQVDVILMKHCFSVLDPETGADIWYEGKSLKAQQYDMVIPKLHYALDDQEMRKGLSILRQMEIMGLPCLNSTDSVASMIDKFSACQVLVNHHIPTPPVLYAPDTDVLLETLEKKPKWFQKLLLTLFQHPSGMPLVLKELLSSKGVGVFLAETPKQADDFLRISRNLKGDMLAQRYIGEAKGQSIRCFVLGDEVAVAESFENPDKSDFRSNSRKVDERINRRHIPLAPAERKMAVAATRAFGAHNAGVDILRTRRGPIVLEVNDSPGMDKEEAQCLINYVEKQAMAG